MMVTDFRCWWRNHYVGDFFRYDGDFLNVLNRSLTFWIGHQHLKLDTNTFSLQYPSPTWMQPVQMVYSQKPVNDGLSCDWNILQGCCVIVAVNWVQNKFLKFTWNKSQASHLRSKSLKTDNFCKCRMFHYRVSYDSDYERAQVVRNELKKSSSWMQSATTWLIRRI